MTSIMDYFWNGDLRTGSTQSAKPKRISTTYPDNPTYNNPGQISFQLSNQPDVRQFFKEKMTQFNQLAQPQLWSNAYHITESLSVGNPLPQIILQQDPTLLAEAQQNGMALQMLMRLRYELNSSNFAGFFPLSMQGLMQTFQQLLSGGIPGLNLPGLQTNLLSAFQQIASQVQQFGQQQNTATQNNQTIPNMGIIG